DSLLHPQTLFGLRYAWQRHRASSLAATNQLHLDAGAEFARRVAQQLSWPSIDAVYGFNSAALPLLQAARDQNKRAFLDQTILPRALHTQILADEERAFPSFMAAPEAQTDWTAFSEREAAE